MRLIFNPRPASPPFHALYDAGEGAARIAVAGFGPCELSSVGDAYGRAAMIARMDRRRAERRAARGARARAAHARRRGRLDPGASAGPSGRSPDTGGPMEEVRPC